MRPKPPTVLKKESSTHETAPGRSFSFAKGGLCAIIAVNEIRAGLVAGRTYAFKKKTVDGQSLARSVGHLFAAGRTGSL